MPPDQLTPESRKDNSKEARLAEIQREINRLTEEREKILRGK